MYVFVDQVNMRYPIALDGLLMNGGVGEPWLF
jgi:hypothetical protein